MNAKTAEPAVTLKIPQSIRRLAGEFRKSRIEREQLRKLADKKETAKAKRQVAKERRELAARIKPGLKDATKVFLWAQAFIKSKIGQEFLQLGCNIEFFEDELGGGKIYFEINPDGLFVRERRHPDTTSAGNQQLSPEELAESVHAGILKIASKWIRNGEVWRYIRRRYSR